MTGIEAHRNARYTVLSDIDRKIARGIARQNHQRPTLLFDNDTDGETVAHNPIVL